MSRKQSTLSWATVSDMTNTADEEPATLDETRAEALRLTGRNYTTVRHLLVQQPRGSASRPSTLGTMVTDRKHRALLLYLLLLTLWPFLKTRRDPFDGALWARLLSTETAGMPWTPSDISKAWRDLEGLGLVSRTREGRALRVMPRREDGKAEWTQPGLAKKDRAETYFVLPGVFWTNNDFAALSFPALAMLLIIAAETSADEEVRLTADLTAEWYGISPWTVKTGIQELEKAGLLRRRPQQVKAKLSATGSTTHWWYSLTGAYSHTARTEARRLARTERATRQRRLAKKAGAKKKSSSKKAAAKTSTNKTPPARSSRATKST